MNKVKLYLKRLGFKYKVKKIMKSRKVKSLNTLVVTHADRQIGKTTYLVNLSMKDEHGVLVVATQRQKQYAVRKFPWVNVFTAHELIRDRKAYRKLNFNLYIDECVTQTEVEALMPYYTVMIFLKYMHVSTGY